MMRAKTSRKPSALGWAASPLLAAMLLLCGPSIGSPSFYSERSQRQVRVVPLQVAQGFSRKRAEQWQNMAPAEKETLRQRMDQWNQMDPQDRQRYQQRYDQWKHLSPEEQQQIDRKLEGWKDLSPSEKEDVRRRFR